MNKLIMTYLDNLFYVVQTVSVNMQDSRYDILRWRIYLWDKKRLWEMALACASWQSSLHFQDLKVIL